MSATPNGGQGNWQLDTTQTIQVPEGFTIRFAWTDFDTRSREYVQIIDGDRTELTPRLTMRYEIGKKKVPPPGTSNTNIMHVDFHTIRYDHQINRYNPRKGWRLEWGKY